MRLEIFSTAAEQIRAHAQRDHPREACGLLLGREGRIEAAIETANVAADTRSAFEIDPALLLRCHRAARADGLAVLGWYHSHPNGRPEPSAMDAARADELGKLWLIAAGDRLRAFRAVQEGPIARRFAELDLAIVCSTPGVAPQG